MPRPTPLATLVKVAGSRWTVEECFQTGKGPVGLDQHQVRRWRSWYRFIFAALVARPADELGHRLRWSCGGDDIKPAPVPATTDDRPPGHHEDHDLRLECKPARLVASHLPSNAEADHTRQANLGYRHCG
jgi:hypothetical protein